MITAQRKRNKTKSDFNSHHNIKSITDLNIEEDSVRLNTEFNQINKRRERKKTQYITVLVDVEFTCMEEEKT